MMMKLHAAQRPVNDGLYYTHANKSRRKLTITIAFICFACLSTTAKCDDDKIIRVDPLGILKILFHMLILFSSSQTHHGGFWMKMRNIKINLKALLTDDY
jgi:hypothetical protein